MRKRIFHPEARFFFPKHIFVVRPSFCFVKFSFYADIARARRVKTAIKRCQITAKIMASLPEELKSTVKSSQNYNPSKNHPKYIKHPLRLYHLISWSFYFLNSLKARVTLGNVS